MRRIRDDSAEMPGQDSFLDVVTNIVGILILLVMVMGVRAGRSMDHVSGAATVAPRAEPVDPAVTEEAVRTAFVAHGETQDMIRRVMAMNRETQLRSVERQIVSDMVAQAEDELEQRRAALSAKEQKDFDLRRQLATAQAELEELGRQQVAIASQAPEVETIECLPTPLGKTVTGKEVHVRLSEGHVAFIPLDKILEDLKGDLEQNKWRLQKQMSYSGRLGPWEGFRADYRVGRVPFHAAAANGMVRSGYVISLLKIELQPMATPLGEPVEQAIMPDSDLMRQLATFRPESTTVTIWLYVNSFDKYQVLRRALHEKGFTTAAHPLPDGYPITGSPYGSKSVTD